jgi:hypothetical protein
MIFTEWRVSAMTDRAESLDSQAKRVAIADKIQHFLDGSGRTRKDLEDPTFRLSKSTIEKFFQGRFSEKTLTKIEAILQTTFVSQAAPVVNQEQASRLLGGYTLQTVDRLQGNYLAVRPLFSKARSLNAYMIRIAWDRSSPGLIFEEHDRRDHKHTQVGSIHIPFGAPFMNLVSMGLGSVRLIILSLPERDGLSKGIITTLSNPKGAILIPATSPIFLRRLAEDEQPELGYISPENPAYLNYQNILETVIAEDYCSFVPPPLQPTERRRGIAIIKP